MGLYCDIIRLNDNDIKRALSLKDKTEELYTFIQNTDPDNWLELEKSWHGMHFMLTQKNNNLLTGFLINGGEVIREYNWIKEYGVNVTDMRVFSSTKTSIINKQLSNVAIKKLKKNYDPALMFKNDIYPGIWEKKEFYTSRFIAKHFKISRSLDYLVNNFEKLQKFIRETSEENKGIIIKYHQ